MSLSLGDVVRVGHGRYPSAVASCPRRVLFECEAVVRPIPWKVPVIGKKGVLPLPFQPKDYRDWVSHLASLRVLISVGWIGFSGWGDLIGEPGPFDLDVLCVMERRPGRNPDRTNLVKGYEDLLQGIVYANDTAIQGGDGRRVYIGDRHPGGGVWEGPERLHLRLSLSA